MAYQVCKALVRSAKMSARSERRLIERRSLKLCKYLKNFNFLAIFVLSTVVCTNALAIYKKKQLWFQLFYLSFTMGSLTSLSI